MDAAGQWPIERVLSWLEDNAFSSDWIATFKELDLHGSRFLELGRGHHAAPVMVHKTILPQLTKECNQSGTGWDATREREQGRRLRRLVREIVEEGSTGQTKHTPVNRRASTQRLSTFPEYVPDEPSPVVHQDVQITSTPLKVETGEESPGFQIPIALTSPIASSTIAQRRLSNQRTQANVVNALSEMIPSELMKRKQVLEPAMKAVMEGLSTHKRSPTGSLSGRNWTGLTGSARQEFERPTVSPQLSPAIQQAVRFAPGAVPVSSISSPQRFYHKRSRSSETNVDASQSNIDPQEPRKNGSESVRPILLDANRNLSSEIPSSTKSHGFFLKNMLRNRKKDDSHPSPDEITQSPSSPNSMRFSRMTNPVVDVKTGKRSPPVAVAEQERTPKSPSHRGSTSRFIFITPDSWNYRLVDVSATLDMETFKSLLAYNLGVSDDRITGIHVTSPGQLDHNEVPMSDAALMKLIHNADAVGTLKIFVQTPETTIFSAGLAGLTTPLQSNHRLSQINKLPSVVKPLDEATYAKLTSKAHATDSVSQQPLSTTISQASKGRDNKVVRTTQDLSGSERLAAAAEAHRRETERKQKLYLEGKNRLKAESPIDPNNTGLRRHQGVIDFDYPRVSPFIDEERNDTLVPLRKPPPVPPDTTTLIKANSLSRKASSARSSISTRSELSARSSVSTRGDVPLTKKLSYEESKVDQLDRGRQKSKADSVTRGSRGATTMKSSRLSSFISTPVSPSITEAARPALSTSHGSQGKESQRAMAMVNFNESGSRKGSPGGSPRSPGFTMSKGNIPFKIPDYEDDSPGDAGSATSDQMAFMPLLEPPRRSSRRVSRAMSRMSTALSIVDNELNSFSPERSPGISPATTQPPRPLPRRSTVKTGPTLDFTENHVSFDKKLDAGSPDDDSDDGLFAVPLVSKEDPVVQVRNDEDDDDGDDDDDEGLFAVPLHAVGKRASFVSMEVSPGGFRHSPEHHTPQASRLSWTSDSQVKTPASMTRPALWDRNSDPSVSEPQSAKSTEIPHTATTAGTSMTWTPESPGESSRTFRRQSFASDVWASRPPPEALVENLDEFFPNVDLDQPMIEGRDETPPSSPNHAAPSSPSAPGLQGTSQNTSKKPTVDRETYDPNAMPLTRGGIGGIPNMHTVAHNRTVSRSTRLARTKSIREVVKDAYEVGSMNGPKMSRVNSLKSSSIVRRKSTKMFGARIEQIKPPRGSRLIHLETIPQDTLPSASVPQRQATFKWVKGQLIGKGTFGRVYLGMNTTTGELLAVKQVEINPKLFNADKEKIKEMVKALDSEIDTMQHLDHVNIVQYLGCERKEYSISIFLEYISGGSIGSCLRKHGKFEESVVSSLTRQTLAGLAYLHHESILHRDLKADNILLDTDGTCKISDFGISKKSNDIYGNDKTNSMQGSVFWMAPEVVRSEGTGYSAKVDIWSLGCVVLEMFAGRRPWGKEEAVGAIFKLGELNQAPPIPDDVSENISPAALSFMWDCFNM